VTPSRRRVATAAAAVALTAADTYVVVVALPAIGAGVGVGVDQLGRLASVVTAFLAGYVAFLPLLGRLADRTDRRSVVLGCLVAVAVGAGVTATAHSLTPLLVGRALQGAGGGGLVPATLGLVADRYAAGRRGLPLGLVSGAQELGALAGPVLGIGALALVGWRGMFGLLAGLALLLAVAVRPEPVRRRDPAGAAALVVAAVAAGLLLAAPPGLVNGLRSGTLYLPVVGGSRWLAPLGLVALAGAVVLVVRGGTAGRPLLPLRGLPRLARATDAAGGLLLAAVLACLVVVVAPGQDTGTATSSSDGTRVLAAGWPWWTAAGLLAAGLALLRARRRRGPAAPLGDRRTFAAALAVSALVGVGLIAVLVDVPLFARLTTFPDDQTGAALVLVRFLAAVPVGAVAGGLLARGRARAPVTATALLVAAGAVGVMTRWSPQALGGGLRASDVALVVAGLGLGVVLAPLNDAALAAAPPGGAAAAASHLVLARSLGQLLGLAVLAAAGSAVFAHRITAVGTPQQLCPADPVTCKPYKDAAKAAGVGEVHLILAVAAGCLLVAAVVALVGLWPRPARA
jgi:MFS family permease